MSKKILLCVPSLTMGGMERVLVTYANLLVMRNYDVTVLNYSSDDPDIVALLLSKVKYLRNYRPFPNIKQASVRDIFKGNFRIMPFDKWLQKKNPTMLHRKMIKNTYDVEISFFGAELIRLVSGCGNPSTHTMCWIHSENISGIFSIISGEKEKKQIFGKINSVICVSDKVAEKIKAEIPWHPKILTLYNPNDTAYIRKIALETEGVPEKRKLTFAMVCRLSMSLKGLDRLVECVARLQTEFDFEIWLVGDGTDRKEVTRLIEENGVHCIKLLGKQTNPYKYLNAADVFLCTSRVEGFSLTMSEAVSLAKPILTTDVSGAHEMLGDSEYGYIVENSVDGIYGGMKLFMEDSSLIEHYKKKIEERKNYFSEDAVIGKLEEIAGL